ncbi:MAG: DUF362 domain-containing protein [Desulfobacterales bacterium]|jgi:uncharacterized protein (DUF362 family)|nr:DUF362 domain-containing protein [Desulfobacterales bacterium]
MPPADALNRREFLSRAARAGAVLAAAGATGYLAHDPSGPGPAPIGGQVAALPDFSVPAAGRRLSIARGADRARTLGLALEALGGIGAFIRKGDRVVLKVNAAFASPPVLSATTHPLIVAELTRLCFAAGAAAVTVTDNPINDPASCFALTGIGPAARAAGAAVALPAEALFREVTLKEARLIRNWPVLLGPLANATKLIGTAPVKDHHRSGASMTMKNWYGLLGGRRNIFHQDVHTLIAELALMVKPTLVILDGTNTMMTNGPTGGSLADLRQTDTLIVGTDHVAVDACGAALLDKQPADLPFIAKAAALGAGTADFGSLDPIEVRA